ncbi:MAG: hypothetical protein K8R58_04165 [Bacteroidales bacterium]|nr:hypothetical protein [Bacteroidales bacterium]
MFLKIIIISAILIGFAVLAIAIKMFVLKGGEFKKQCGSVDPKTGKRISCTCGEHGNSAECHNKSKD